MAKTRWEMKIGSPVMATDGEFGYLQMVIMDPHQERVVALLVRQYGLIAPHTIVVPEDKIADATDREVRLKINLEQVDALPEYKPEIGLVVEGQKYEVDDESFAVRGKEGMQVGRPPTSRRPGMLESQFAQSEREHQALQLRTGHKVYCRDGRAGKVSLMLLNPDGRVKGFVMHTGRIPGHNLIVPVTWVREVDKENVHLLVKKAALQSLSEYSSDFALADEVNSALWDDEILRMTDYKDIEITVENGIVFLRGHVDTAMNRTRAEDAAHLIHGILGIENHLVVDGDLAIDVAQVLGNDERTQLESVTVNAQNGFITLNGQVASAAIRQAAEELAASVPQVRGVVNHLHAPNVVIDPEEEQVLEPPIRGEVYATDMFLGLVEHIIINPHNRRVTALVVHGDFPDLEHVADRNVLDKNTQKERWVVVPTRLERYETDNSVQLNISGVDAARYHDFDPADFVSPPDEAWEPPYPYHWGNVLFEREYENE